MRFKYMNSLIHHLSERQAGYCKQRDLLLSKPKASHYNAKVEQALRYEQLIARIIELDLVIETLIHALNLEQIDHDRRRNDRRKKEITA